jgi:hypothetical protein
LTPAIQICLLEPGMRMVPMDALGELYVGGLRWRLTHFHVM